MAWEELRRLEKDDEILTKKTSDSVIEETSESFHENLSKL